MRLMFSKNQLQREFCKRLERLEFSWEGQSENDPTSGRGWAVINGDYLEGRIYIHLSDDSWFKAKKVKADR
jgi:hypothetical protein